MRRRRTRHHEQDDQERWLITYADLITLLMIFFVIMYAMSQINQVKFIALEQSLAQALHRSDQISLNETGQQSMLQTSSAANTQSLQQAMHELHQSQQDKALDNLYQQVHSYITQHHLEANVSITNQQRGVQITLRDVVLFDTGQAVIKPGAQVILNGLAPFFQKLSNPIIVEGYTDDRPINTYLYPTNWELSAARAVGVVRYLIHEGVSPLRLSGTAYGQYHPLMQNDTSAHLQANRRVNIVIARVSNTALASQ